MNGKLEVSLDSDGCRGSTYSRVNYLEHVQAVVTLTASRRGEVEIFLTSPQGTRSTLLARRARDTSPDGFTGWAFMTTHCWSENAVGTWKLEVRNGDSVCKSKSSCYRFRFIVRVYCEHFENICSVFKESALNKLLEYP